MFVLALKSLEMLILRDKCYNVYCFLLEEKILNLIMQYKQYMAYMLSWLKIYVFVTKAATIAHVNFQARAMDMILV